LGGAAHTARGSTNVPLAAGGGSAVTAVSSRAGGALGQGVGASDASDTRIDTHGYHIATSSAERTTIALTVRAVTRKVGTGTALSRIGQEETVVVGSTSRGGSRGASSAGLGGGAISAEGISGARGTVLESTTIHALADVGDIRATSGIRRHRTRLADLRERTPAAFRVTTATVARGKGAAIDGGRALSSVVDDNTAGARGSISAGHARLGARAELAVRASSAVIAVGDVSAGNGARTGHLNTRSWAVSSGSSTRLASLGGVAPSTVLIGAAATTSHVLAAVHSWGGTLLDIRYIVAANGRVGSDGARLAGTGQRAEATRGDHRAVHAVSDSTTINAVDIGTATSIGGRGLRLADLRKLAPTTSGVRVTCATRNTSGTILGQGERQEGKKYDRFHAEPKIE